MRSRRYVAYFRFPDFTLGMSVTQIAWELVFIVCLFPSDLEVRVCVKVRNMNRDCWFHWSQPFFFSFGRLRQCRICNSTKQKKKHAFCIVIYEFCLLNIEKQFGCIIYFRFLSSILYISSVIYFCFARWAFIFRSSITIFIQWLCSRFNSKITYTYLLCFWYSFFPIEDTLQKIQQ